jgi:hypothetical protein
MHRQSLNDRIAVKVTDMVSSMWCAYAFVALALFSLPSALRGGSYTLVTWISQTFLQLVLLSVIMVGQEIGQKKSDRRSEKTYRDTEEILKRLHEHDEKCDECRKPRGVDAHSG